MRRSFFLLVVLLGCSLAGAITIPVSSISVTNITSNSATVAWSTDVTADTCMLLGWYGGYRQQICSNDAPGLKHTIQLTGLRANDGVHGQYFYLLRSKDANGVAVFYDSMWSGPSFWTLAAPTGTGQMDVWLRINGPRHVTQGFGQVFGVELSQASGASVQQNVTIAVSNLPPATVINWPDFDWNGLLQGTHNSDGSLTQWGVSASNQFQLVTSANTPAGLYKAVTVTVTAKGLTATDPVTHLPYKYDFIKSVRFDLTVDAPQAWVAQKLGVPPAIPNRALMEGYWVTYAQRWGGLTATQAWACVANDEQGCLYYDGLRGFLQLKQYDAANKISGNPAQWDPLIAKAHDAYASMIATGDMRGYWVFPHGLYLFGDTANVHKLWLAARNHQMWANTDQPYDTAMMREMSYLLNTARLDQHAGYDHTKQIEQLVEYLLGYLERVQNGDPDSGVFMPYMGGGLATEALTGYFDDGHQNDPRIRPAVKSHLDWLWANTWNTWSQDNAFVMQFAQFQFGENMGLPFQNELRGLNDLIAPGYAWLYKEHAGDVYRSRADAIAMGFFAAPLGDTIGFRNGKNFSQTFKEWIDYVTCAMATDAQGLDKPRVTVSPQ